MSEALQRAFGPVWRALTGRKAYNVGLHIGLERLNLMQLQPGTGGPTVLAAASIKHESSRDDLIANPVRLKGLVKRAFAEQPFSGNRVVTCLPSDHVKFLLLNYTVAEGASESDSVVRELRGACTKNSMAWWSITFRCARAAFAPEGGDRRDGRPRQVTAYSTCSPRPGCRSRRSTWRRRRWRG